jgi:DNA mismatch endonuclease (patch repair protein)
MADVFTIRKRSNVMSRIRASGNRDTELRMIEIFRTAGIAGWRRNAKVFGKPDFLFQKQRVAVFVDGCFWHRHLGCRFAYTPKSRLEFWLPKLNQKIARDKVVGRQLRRLGWKVIRVWECELQRKHWPRTAARLIRLLNRA